MSRFVAIAALSLAILASAGPTSGATRNGHCMVRHHAIAGVRHSAVLARSGAIVVYRTRGAELDTIWACKRGAAARVRLGADDSYQQSGEYSGSSILSHISIAGDWVIATVVTGLDAVEACSKYHGEPCPSAQESLVVANAATARVGEATKLTVDNSPGPGDTIGVSLARALITPAGTVAWLETGTEYRTNPSSQTALPSSLWACVPRAAGAHALSCQPQRIAQGAIAPRSVTLSGRMLAWSQDAVPHSATVQG